MKIWSATKYAGDQPIIVVDEHHANVLRSNGWYVEESNLPDEQKAGIAARIMYASLATAGIIACSLWLVSYAYAAPCPSPVAGAGVPAVSCERTGS